MPTSLNYRGILLKKNMRSTGVFEPATRAGKTVVKSDALYTDSTTGFVADEVISNSALSIQFSLRFSKHSEFRILT